MYEKLRPVQVYSSEWGILDRLRVHGHNSHNKEPRRSGEYGLLMANTNPHQPFNLPSRWCVDTLMRGIVKHSF